VSYYRTTCVKTCAVAAILLHTATMMGEEQQTGAGLIEFKSAAGKFSIRLPAKPAHEITEVGTAKEKQHQFKVGTERGVYLVSYQDNPNLEGSSPEQLMAALESGRDRLQKIFSGKLLESKSVTLGKTHPGLNFRVEIPQANGEARCRFYLVGTRLYQIMALGVPEFANSNQATQVIDSFQLLK
jgi:hypothetical protein